MRAVYGDNHNLCNHGYLNNARTTLRMMKGAEDQECEETRNCYEHRTCHHGSD